MTFADHDYARFGIRSRHRARASLRRSQTEKTNAKASLKVSL